MDLDAIKRAHTELMRVMYSGDPVDAIKTGIREVDDLLPCVQDDSADGRGLFLASILEVASEQTTDAIRGRQALADKASECILEAARLLEELDNAPSAAALKELVPIIKALGATERLHVVIDSEGIAPGIRALVLHQPTHRSTLQSRERGKATHRANIIRHLAQLLKPSAPLSAIARLVTAAGLDCTHADVGQALGRQQSTPGFVQESTPGFVQESTPGLDLQNIWL